MSLVAEPEPCFKKELLCEMDPSLGTFECRAYEPIPVVAKNCSTSGYCDESILGVLDTLEKAESAEEALEEIDVQSMDGFLDQIVAVVNDPLASLTAEEVASAFFPDPSASITFDSINGKKPIFWGCPRPPYRVKRIRDKCMIGFSNFPGGSNIASSVTDRRPC